jgi:hypothetical protein
MVAPIATEVYRREGARLGEGELRRRNQQGWWPAQGKAKLFDPASVAITRYRLRGEQMPSLWSIEGTGSIS